MLNGKYKGQRQLCHGYTASVNEEGNDWKSASSRFREDRNGGDRKYKKKKKKKNASFGERDRCAL
jgi:hypothetical protein